MSASLEQPNASLNEQHTPNPRPSLPRSNSIPSWPNNASTVSLRSPQTLQLSATPAPLLRKRHSTYVLPTPPDPAKTPVPDPDPSPIRPLCNPALGVITTQAPLSKKKNGVKGLPSLTTNSHREITWELQPETMNDKLSQASPVASDSSSPMSTRLRQSLATGPVSEVAPWEMYPVRRSATSHTSLTSGSVEEVTPWELHPVPTVMPNRSTLATGPVEDVTPWELGPAPPSSTTISEKQFSTRGPTSPNQEKSPSEVTHSRRRKSTSAKATKPRFTFFGSSFSTGHPSGSRNLPLEDLEPFTKSAPKLIHITSPRARLPPLSPLPMINGYDTRTGSQQNIDFLTADRTIFGEPKQPKRAREAQFVVKGQGTLLGSPLTHRGKKHHAFPLERVPYPRSYEQEVVDLDVWETTSCQDIFESLTLHVFQTPPIKVLDIGCGTGTWILNCAKAWKDCHFVGLDIVALQPDLNRVGTLDLASRITWVHANFLESLPFPDGEFDFVHIKRIALGVPENKWDGLFQEIVRVMKPGGILEMLEEDIFFPGKSVDNEKLDVDIESEKRSLVHSSHHGSTKSYTDTNFESLLDSGPPSFRSSGHSPPTSTTATFPETPSRSNSPVADVVISEDMEEEAREILSYVIGDDYILPPEDGQILNDATDREHSQVKTPQLAFASSMVSLNPSSAGSATAPDSETSIKSKARTRSRAHSLSVFLSSAINAQQPSPGSEIESLLLRTVPKPPPNPRDHSLLEVIYTRLLKSRSINMSPLALLAEHIGYYFQDVRSHPPLQYHFPIKNHPSDHDGGNGEDSESDRSSSDDTDDARDAILPSPISRTIKRKRSRRNPTQNQKEGVHHVGGQKSIHHSASYLTLDELSPSTLSSSIKGMSPDTSSASPQRGFLLPNTSVHLDSKTSHMHLALRAAEIVACSETMWEWVQKFSAKVKAHREREAVGRPASRPCRSGSGSIEMPTRRSNVSIATSSPDPYESSILDLTREEFDGLVSRFEMDMREICDIQNTLRERFCWHTSEPTVSTEREAFDKACEKWDKWEQEQLVASLSHARSHDQIRNPPPAGAYVTTQPSAAGNRVQGRPVSVERSKKRISDTPGSSPLRLSRSMRIFLARKSYSTPSDP